MTFDDIFLYPAPISTVVSRNDTNTNISLCKETLSVPLISSNMTSVYSTKQADILASFGAKAVIHRFTSIEDNVKLLKQSPNSWVSVGVSDAEYTRAEALVDAGAKVVCLEVANAASLACITAYKRLRTHFKGIQIVVGTFATKEQVNAFIDHAGSIPDAFLVGVGNGAACTTGSEVTGVHMPIIHTILSTVKCGVPVIVSGGVSKPGDMVKCLALGATAVMCGKIFSACYESGAKGFSKDDGQYFKDPSDKPHYKWYYGSASLDAYEEQDKVAKHRAVEGKGMMIKTTGTTEELLTYYQASLRSAMTYVDAKNIEEFHKNVQWGIKNDVTGKRFNSK